MALPHRDRGAQAQVPPGARGGATWAEEEDGRSPALQIGSLVAGALGEGDGWRAARALVGFRALLGSPFFQKALAWSRAEGRRVDAERALRARRRRQDVHALGAAPPRAA